MTSAAHSEGRAFPPSATVASEEGGGRSAARIRSSTAAGSAPLLVSQLLARVSVVRLGQPSTTLRRAAHPPGPISLSLRQRERRVAPHELLSTAASAAAPASRMAHPSRCKALSVVCPRRGAVERAVDSAVVPASPSVVPEPIRLCSRGMA